MHWSLSTVANKIRSMFGIENPVALSFSDWAKHEEESKKKNAFIYWLTTSGFDHLQAFVFSPITFLQYIDRIIDNRFINKSWCLKSKLPKTGYYSFGDLMLNSMFDSLVDYVEITKAMPSCNSWVRRIPIVGLFSNLRNIESGVKYLEWESGLIKDHTYYGYSSYSDVPDEYKKLDEYGEKTKQALVAIEILELYHWWKNRPNRKCPMDESGWSEYCDTHDIWGSQPDDIKKSILDKCHAIELKYEAEDSEYCTRLLNIRKYLW
jgi:hypothetical protein